MHHFSSDGVDIAFRDFGAGDPILLIHGFASNSQVNWVSTSWTETLLGDGRRAIAMDVRGHGASTKLYEPVLYSLAAMARDAAGLLDHLAIGRADVMGYSMGARIGAVLTLAAPEKVRSLVIGGMGINLVGGHGHEEEIARALEADSDEAVTSELGGGYRAFAGRTGSDLRALAAAMRGQRTAISPGQLAEIRAPVLIAVGSEDQVAGSAQRLARLVPEAECVIIERRDHMLATGDKRFKAAVLDFLKRRP